MAYTMARGYMLVPKTGEDLLNSVSEDPFGKTLAADFKRLLAAGKINHYSDFAAERLSKCIRKMGADPEPFQNGIRICYARTDIAFFLLTEGGKATSKEQLVLKVRKILADPDVYPEGLIEAVANLLYPRNSSDEAQLASRVILRSCLAQAKMLEAVN